MTTNYNYRSFPASCVTTSAGVATTNSAVQVLNGGSLRNSKTTDQFRRSVNGGNFESPTLNTDLAENNPATYTSLSAQSLEEITAGFVGFSSPELNVGDTVFFDSDLYTRKYLITADDGEFVTTDCPYISDETVTVYKVTGTINDGSTPSLIAKVSEGLQTGASKISRDKIKSVHAIRTLKTNTAIRSGQFDEVTGEFAEGYPEAANDFSSFGADSTTQNHGSYGLRTEYVIRGANNRTISGVHDAP